MKKIIICLLILSYCFLIFPSKRFIPIIIDSETKVFNIIAKEMSKKLPKKIEILVYNLNLLNGEEEIKNKLNDNFYKIFFKMQSFYGYFLTFEKDLTLIKIDNKEIGLGKLLNKDAVMISSITVIEGKLKSIWDEVSKKWVKKKIALYQGNIFIVDTCSVILRFSYYFYLD